MIRGSPAHQAMHVSCFRTLTNSALYEDVKCVETGGETAGGSALHQRWIVACVQDLSEAKYMVYRLRCQPWLFKATVLDTGGISVASRGSAALIICLLW